MEPLRKNQEHTVTIQDLTHEGLGIAKIAGIPVFIPNTLPEETARIALTKVGKKFAYARLLELHTTAPYRVDIRDMKATWVGTMPLQHLSYEQQLLFKQQQVRNVCRKIAGLNDVLIHPTLPAPQTVGYRNKAQIPVRAVDGQLTTGFFRKNSHQLVPMEDFIIQDPEIDKVILTVRNVLRQYGIAPYDERQHQGCVRTIMVRRGVATGEIQVVVVTRTKQMPHHEAVTQAICAAHPEVVSVVHNHNPQRTNTLLGKNSQSWHGPDRIHDQLLGLTFAISSQSFYQVNPRQTERLYQAVVDAAQLTGREIVIDAYCGIGTISLVLAQHAAHVYGVELVAEAIDCARHNAQLNERTNTTFQVGQAEKVMTEWHQAGLQPDVIVVDPPRKGLERQFIDAAVATAPQRIIYVSCNPATMARDLAHFTAQGYDVTAIQPVDMFPQTTHVECVALLVKASNL